MSEPYLGQIEFFAFNYAPKGWVTCAGQLLPINQYQALFSLLGTTYGGNGTTNFQLPDLRSRIPVAQGTSSQGNNWVLGETQGEENHTLLITELPGHTHSVSAVSGQLASATLDVPSATTVLAQAYQGGAGTAANTYATDSAPSQNMSPQAIGPAGNNLPHPNIMPSLALNACISMSGLFPSRN